MPFIAALLTVAIVLCSIQGAKNALPRTETVAQKVEPSARIAGT